MSRYLRLAAICWLWPCYAVAAGAVEGPVMTCPPPEAAAVQVLGSGGPIADDARASSAYLLWLGGRARALVDVGGGAFLRFGEAGARFEDLDIIALSHFHTDHSADLPALLKSGYFSDRDRELTVSGPGGESPFPGLEAFLGSLLGSENGAFGYLDGYLDGSDGLVKLEPITVPHRSEAPRDVLSTARFNVEALGVPHGIVPSLAYRFRLAGKTVVFAADQNGESRAFIDFARDADLMIAHLAIPESASGAAVALHARPSAVGKMARQAGVRQLVLSHVMARSLSRLDDQLAIVRKTFAGPVHVAGDLECFLP